MSYKKLTSIVVLFVFVVMLSSCADSTASNRGSIATPVPTSTPIEVLNTQTPKPTPVPTPKPTSSTSNNYSGSSGFTNKFGTATTKCAHSGCSNFIASSGDTNCCTTHSRKCLECKKYIDEDATYCMSCISKALGGK